MKKIFVFIACCLLPTVLRAQQWHSIPNPNVPIMYGQTGVFGTQVDALKVINNELYVGGGFYYDSSNTSGGIEKFNANTVSWDSLGCGTYGTVESIEYYNGEIYAGGYFLGAKSCLPWPNDFVPNTRKLAKWNGTQWAFVDSSFSNSGGLSSILTLKYNNDLYIGGSFYAVPVSNGPAKMIVKYNGSTLDNMKGGVEGFPLDVRCMAVYKNDLYVGGTFLTAGGITCNNIARWDGTDWYPLGTGLNGPVNALAVDTVNNLLYIGSGATQAGPVSTLYYAIWDGNNWSPLYAPSPNLAPALNAMKFFDGKLFVGAYSVVGSPMDTTLFYWDVSSGWHPVHGPNEGVAALEVYNGNLYVGGYFNKIDTTTVNCIACYGDSCPGTPITLTLPYGVNEMNKPALKFKVYPNPAKREINIEVTGDKGQGTREKYMVRIKNSLGQEIYKKDFSRQLKVDTSQFPKGVCLVEVCTIEGKVCHTEKVVIE